MVLRFLGAGEQLIRVIAASVIVSSVFILLVRMVVGLMLISRAKQCSEEITQGHDRNPALGISLLDYALAGIPQRNV
jgi:hypothetical protein